MFTTFFTALGLAALVAGLLGSPAAPSHAHSSGTVSAYDGTQGGPPGANATP